ncbi:hypothetical protein FDN13_01800 [Caloramator sp. E03]|uniref:hypothetical protein n=1 Tax=Caloramator sp. E03 TaxID=2576307 RepID=UPI00111008FE|nr:hypothetical protein [Caloramator sp. E03]QCX32527.1 hypothetical protein FDN13_01800 [Caloramator sp. E03]
MTDKEKLMAFEKYMRDVGYDKDTIDFNLKVVKLLINKVLFFFQESLETIDSFCFEEFTDMITMIDSEFGGRDGISKMLDAMMVLTEFLKVNKFIKGGKIAYYKKMFSDVNYYLDKYDRLTGRKDDSKEFIKEITTNRFASSVVRIVEDVNVYDFETIDLIDRILNDVPISEKNENVDVLKSILCYLKLLEQKNSHYEATKKGRCLSRLPAEERYAAILNLLLYYVNWNFLKIDDIDIDLNFRDVVSTFASIFKDKKELIVDINELLNVNQDEILIEMSKDVFRIAKAESMPFSQYFVDICFKGMGLLDVTQDENNVFTYSTNDFGQNIFKAIYNESISDIKLELEIIGLDIRKRNDYDNIEKKLIKFISTYGPFFFQV